MKLEKQMISQLLKQKRNERRRRKAKVEVTHLKTKHQFHFNLAQTTATDDNTEIDGVSNGTEAIAALSIQQEGIHI
jgi:hypothetical protein